jgi:hypothetical protein
LTLIPSICRKLLNKSELFALFEFSVSCEPIRIVISMGA